MPVMKSLRSFYFATTTGHCIQVQANVPVHIPDVCVAQAMESGMVPTDEPLPDANGNPAPAVNTVEAIPTTPVAEDPDEPDVDDIQAVLDAAVIRILTRNDDSDFKNDGTPKAQRVNAELPPESPRATATEIADAFERCQENFDLVD